MEYKGVLDVMKAFPDEESCIAHLEKTRWPNGIICLCCGSSRKIYRLARGSGYKCADCIQIFLVRKGTIFGDDRLDLMLGAVSGRRLTYKNLIA